MLRLVLEATPRSRPHSHILRLFFPPDVARKLIQHFAIEYSTFRFDSNPAWLEEATGEYQTFANGPCTDFLDQKSRTYYHVFP